MCTSRYIQRVAKYYHTRSGRYLTPCQLQTSTARALMAIIAPPGGWYRLVMILIAIMLRKIAHQNLVEQSMGELYSKTCTSSETVGEIYSEK